MTFHKIAIYKSKLRWLCIFCSGACLPFQLQKGRVEKLPCRTELPGFNLLLWPGCYLERVSQILQPLAKLLWNPLGKGDACASSLLGLSGAGATDDCTWGPTLSWKQLAGVHDWVNKTGTMCWLEHDNPLVPWVLSEDDGAHQSDGDGFQSQGRLVCIPPGHWARSAVVTQLPDQSSLQFGKQMIHLSC